MLLNTQRPERPAAYHRQQALQEGGETKSVNLADAVVGPAPTGNAGSDYKKRGSMAVSKVDANGYYYLNVAGEVGHEIRAILQVIHVCPLHTRSDDCSSVHTRRYTPSCR